MISLAGKTAGLNWPSFWGEQRITKDNKFDFLFKNQIQKKLNFQRAASVLYYCLSEGYCNMPYFYV